MPFFELPDPPPLKAQHRRRRRREEHWQRPDTLIPGYLGDDFVLASSDEVAVVIQGIACYPTGFAFELHAVTRYETDPEDGFEHDMAVWPHPHARREVPPTRLRFGIAFSNGEKATTLDPDRFGPRQPSDGEPRPHFTPDGGGGGGGNWREQMWVWPLPPPGPVTFACEWPAFGISETLRDVDGDRFREAAGRAKPVF